MLQHYGQRQDAQVKENISSVVTRADLEAEEAILNVLETCLWKANIISEECGFRDHGSKYTWVVDPLDGTSNFAAGLPWFGTLIALLEGTEPVLAGLYLPVERSLYLAEEGQGAQLNGQPISCSQGEKTEDELIAYSFDYSLESGKTRSEMEMMERLSKHVRNLRSTNSLLDFCYTAEGKLGGAINQTTKIWDIAAPWLLIREAGGIFKDPEGKIIQFDLGADAHSRNYRVMAAGANLHPRLLKIINA